MIEFTLIIFHNFDMITITAQGYKIFKHKIYLIFFQIQSWNYPNNEFSTAESESMIEKSSDTKEEEKKLENGNKIDI